MTTHRSLPDSLHSNLVALCFLVTIGRGAPSGVVLRLKVLRQSCLEALAARGCFLLQKLQCNLLYQLRWVIRYVSLKAVSVASHDHLADHPLPEQ